MGVHGSMNSIRLVCLFEVNDTQSVNLELNKRVT